MPIRGSAQAVDTRKVRPIVTKSQSARKKPTPLPALNGEQSLNRYLTEIRKFPVLTAEQEYMLAKRYQEHEDPEAAAQLVSSHLRLDGIPRLWPARR